MKKDKEIRCVHDEPEVFVGTSGVNGGKNTEYLGLGLRKGSTLDINEKNMTNKLIEIIRIDGIFAEEAR